MKLRFKVAKSWNELNPYQLRKISDILFHAKENDKDAYTLILFYLFCPDNYKSWKGMRQGFKYLLARCFVPKSEFLKHSAFIFESMGLTKFPKSIKHKGVKYYAPADRLSNININELSFAYKFYFEWRVNDSIADLNRLVTTLYRPCYSGRQSGLARLIQGENSRVLGDLRIPFNNDDVATRNLGELPLETKLAIGFAFHGSIELKFSRYKVLFPKSKKDQKQKSKPQYQSFAPMIREMAMGEDKPLGTLEEVKRTNADAFFDIVEATIIRDRKRKQEMEKSKRNRK